MLWQVLYYRLHFYSNVHDNVVRPLSDVSFSTLRSCVDIRYQQDINSVHWMNELCCDVPAAFDPQLHGAHRWCYRRFTNVKHLKVSVVSVSSDSLLFPRRCLFCYSVNKSFYFYLYHFQYCDWVVLVYSDVVLETDVSARGSLETGFQMSRLGLETFCKCLGLVTSLSRSRNPPLSISAQSRNLTVLGLGSPPPSRSREKSLDSITACIVCMFFLLFQLVSLSVLWLGDTCVCPDRYDSHSCY